MHAGFGYETSPQVVRERLYMTDADRAKHQSHIRIHNLPYKTYRMSHFTLSRYRPESEQFVFCNGVALHRGQCAHALGEQWLNSIVEFSRQLHSIQIDISAFACLSALALVNGEW